MDCDYKEVPFTGQRPSPWKINSLPKFGDVPGRKFNGCSNAKTIDGEPPTPPPSPTGTFKYPALLRGSNFWPRNGIGTKIRKSTNRDTRNPGDKKQLIKSQPLQTLQKFFDNVKPASGETKIYLWPGTRSINCPKLDPTSLTRKDLARSLKASTSEIEGLAKCSDIFVPKKSPSFFEAGDTKEDTNAGNGMMSNPSTEDFDEILKHALSHDLVIAKHNSTPRIQRSMILAERPKTVFPVELREVSDRRK